MNDKPRRCDKPVPGCLGRMVNLFDLTSLARNRLLTDKQHNDGPSLSRSQSDVSRISSVARDDIQDKVIISESRRSSPSKKSSGTPMKMLIAQELSTDLHSRHNSSNVVAKLMGLDALPQQQRYSASQRSHSQCHRQSCYSEQPTEYWQEEHGFLDKKIDCEFHLHKATSEYQDIFEIWQQSQRTNSARYNLLQKGRCGENVDEKKLALIRQKFMEAKRLSTDEKLRKTKEFQEALDVLSSSGELFLKVLQEPNSLFSEHLYVGESISPPPETKRITVLRPSKMLVDEKFTAPARRNEKPTKKQVNMWDNDNGFSPMMSTWKANDIPSRPTRIVVLRPSPVKVNDAKAIISSPGESFFEEPKDGQVREAREVAKEITEQMRENIARHRRDETLLSSVFSNGYTGDESSFDKSNNEFAAGNLSDSDVMSPMARHSWDYKCSSPYSSSSLSRASYSPESSVCREAKKRLSERWTMMASNGSSAEQRHARRSSGTLGEMLELSETKNPEICENDNLIDKDPRGAPCGLNSNTRAKECEDDSLRNSQRSKSVPVSSIVYEERLNVPQVLDPVVCKDGASKEMVKTRASKTSFAGKVTSLFFSRNKKTRKDKISNSPLNDESQSTNAETPGTSNDRSEMGLPSETVMGNPSDERLREDFCSHQGRFCASEPNAPRNQRENQDQPSSISVLELPFEEDESSAFRLSHISEQNPCGKQMLVCSSKSNLIDKSPPIGSVARTLSWEESYTEMVANFPLSSPFVSVGAKNDKAEWLFLVQTLLSMAEIDNEANVGTNLSRWHSPMSPLDPILKDKYLNLNAKEPLHEAKRRQLRSNRKLVFDCVNAALVDITGMGTTTRKWVGPSIRTHVSDDGSTMLAQKVWAWVEECCLTEVNLVSVDGEDNHSLVERVARKEVFGKGWVAQSRLEMDNIGKEIEGRLLEELVEESVIEWTGRSVVV